jgi:hypothetical protein
MLDHLQSVHSPDDWKKSEVGQILTTNVDNLRNRANRLCVQLAGSPFVDQANVQTRACKLGSGVWGQTTLDSAVIKVFPKKKSVSELAKYLHESIRPIWGNVNSDHIEIVLRTLSPDDDRALVQRLCDEPMASDERTDKESKTNSA